MEEHHRTPTFPFRRLTLTPVFLLVCPVATVAFFVWANIPLTAHSISVLFIFFSLGGCLIALAYLEVTACARAIVLLTSWPQLRTIRNSVALAVGILSLPVAAALVLTALK